MAEQPATGTPVFSGPVDRPYSGYPPGFTGKVVGGWQHLTGVFARTGPSALAQIDKLHAQTRKALR